LPKHPVDVWTFRLTEPCRECLTAEELARAGRFKFDDDRIRWTRARSSLRLTLSSYTGTAPGDLTFNYGEHGKPALAGFPALEFNLSHAGDYALIAVTRDVPVGIDIERMRANVDMAPLLLRLDETDLPDTQQGLYQRWTFREAKSKAAGGALWEKPHEQIHAIALAAPEGYAAAVALIGHQPTPVAKQ
jgi:4'-phosphopantetheinyl transferase